MSNNHIKRTALVLTTTPNIPREYGNRNRVFQTVQFLKDHNFTVSLLLYPFDEDWVTDVPPYYRELVELFEYFGVIPNTRTLHTAAAKYHHTVDEWWDESIGHQLSWIFARKRFDLFFVNYTFMSRAFEYAPPHVLKVLDTHDLFTGRRETFESNGVGAEFFYTNANEEKIAFDRADAILGIKTSESEFIRTLTKKDVITLPYWAENRKTNRPVIGAKGLKFSHERPVRLGFIGADNSVNAVNMQRFLDRFDRYVKLYNLPVEVIIAGNVCRRLHTEYSFLRKLGRIPTIDEFYTTIDAVIAPLEFSTGIKIKVGEALTWGLPVIATVNAFDGFRSYSSTQSEPTVAHLCNTIAAIATNEISYSDLIIASDRAARSAERAQQKGFSDLQAWIKSKMRRIAIVTDRPFWYRGTFIDEQITQTIEYISKVSTTVVVSLNGEKPNLKAVYANFEYIHVPNEKAIGGLLHELSNACTIDDVILFLDDRRVPIVENVLRNRSFHTWRARNFSEALRPSLTFENPDYSDPKLKVTPLRYAPVQCEKDIRLDRVTVFRAVSLSDWGECVLEHVSHLAAAGELELSTIQSPPYCQYDPVFWEAATRDSAAAIVLLECDETSRALVGQLAKYRGIRSLILGKDIVCPLVCESVSGLPTITGSIAQFFDGVGSAEMSAGANSGWSEVWRRLERNATKTAELS